MDTFFELLNAGDREAAVQQCAENLSGVVIHQRAGSGSPIPRATRSARSCIAVMPGTVRTSTPAMSSRRSEVAAGTCMVVPSTERRAVPSTGSPQPRLPCA